MRGAAAHLSEDDMKSVTMQQSDDKLHGSPTLMFALLHVLLRQKSEAAGCHSLGSGNVALVGTASSCSHVPAGVGHAEPAAGVAGLLALAAALEGRRAAPVLHLRSLNPLVAGILSGRDGRAPLHAQMPRAEAAQGGMGSQQHGELCSL